MSDTIINKIIEAFDKDDTAAKFLSDDGDGGFAGGVYRMARRIDELENALRDLLPPTHGIHGGPLTSIQFNYEDGTNERSARHKGSIGSAEVARIRRVLEDDY